MKHNKNSKVSDNVKDNSPGSSKPTPRRSQRSTKWVIEEKPKSVPIKDSDLITCRYDSNCAKFFKSHEIGRMVHESSVHESIRFTPFGPLHHISELTKAQREEHFGDKLRKYPMLRKAINKKRYRSMMEAIATVTARGLQIMRPVRPDGLVVWS